jgi:hypothetical protein
MAALHFTEADLDANRHGTMTASQRGKLGQKLLEPMIPLPGLVLRLLLMFVLATPFVFIVLALKDSAFTSNGAIAVGLVAGSDLFAWAILVILIGVQFVPAVVSRWWHLRSDLSRGSVSMISGCIYLHVRQRAVLKGTKYDSHLLEVNGLTFLITAFQCQVLTNYQPYSFHIYYLPVSKLILSAEQWNQ